MKDFSLCQPLCTLDDIEGDYSDSALAAACDLIRTECGWHIAPVETETLLLDSDGGRLLTLPSLFVLNVASVVDAQTNKPIDGWGLSQIGLLERTGFCEWPRGRQRIKVTVTHGLASAPPALLAVIEDLVRNNAAAALTPSNVKQASLDGASLTYVDSTGVARDLATTYGHVLRRFSL